jgi:hypothetical protein
MSQYTFDAQLKTQIAKNFVSDFQPFGKNKVYLGIGQIDDVETGNPPLEHRSVERDVISRRNISFAKRVTPDDVTLMIPRVNWSSGITMSPLDTADDMSETHDESGSTPSPFYVVTNENNVYVCLANGGGETGSLDQPIGTDTSAISLPNGYKWKYMYTIPGSHVKFMDSDFIPVVSLPYYDGIFNVYNDERQNQYAVQYEANLDASGGLIDQVAITLNPVTAIFERGVPTNKNNEVEFTKGNTVMITQPNLVNQSDDYYKNYYIRFLTGQAAGVVKKITGSSVNGDAQDILTLESDFETNRIPQNKDRFEIGVGIEISGNGRDAAGFGSLDSSKKLTSVILYNKGSGYSSATANVFTGGDSATDAFPSTLPTIVPLISQSVGRDPVFELFSNVARVQVSIQGDDENNVEQLLGNDYRDIVLWANPKVGANQEGAGNFAGYLDRTITRVDVSGTTGSIAALVETANDQGSNVGNKYLYGDTTKEFVEISGQPSKTSTLSATVNVLDMSKPFVRGEKVTLLQTDSKGLFTGTSSTGDFTVSNTFFEDTSLQVQKTDWRCTHKLVVDFGVDGSYVPTEDQGATGGSGSHGAITAVLPYSNPNDPDDDVFGKRVVLLSDVSNVSGATLSFVPNESLNYVVMETPVSGTIESVEGPELDLFSGQLLYIKGLTQGVRRVTEQTDLFRFTFEF